MNETIETTLLLNLFHYDNGGYSRNEIFIDAKRRKAIAILDEDAEYEETISYLDSLSDEDYHSLKEDLLQQVEVN